MSVRPQRIVSVVLVAGSIGVSGFVGIGAGVGCGKHTAESDAGRHEAPAVVDASSAAAADPVAPPIAGDPLDPRPLDAPEPDPLDLPPPTPLATTCAGVELVIESVERVDEHAVTAVIALRNHSQQYVSLMLTGDGSNGGRRNPAVQLELSPNDALPAIGCGNMNRTNPAELIYLAPGERRTLEWLSPPTPSKPGRYTLRATYRNDPQSNKLGDDPPGAVADRFIARLRKTVPCTLASKPFAFTWTVPAAPKDAKNPPCNCQHGDPLCSCQ